MVYPMKKMFSFYYKSRIAPRLWQQCIVKLILKNEIADPRSPLCYRGIRLAHVSTMSKLHMGILNNRLVSFLEEMSIIEDEQNGFHRAQAYIDHIFVLSSVIRNRRNIALDTFCSCIDTNKAFDCVTRKLLFWKLREEGVHGRLCMLCCTVKL